MKLSTIFSLAVVALIPGTNAGVDIWAYQGTQCQGVAWVCRDVGPVSCCIAQPGILAPVQGSGMVKGDRDVGLFAYARENCDFNWLLKEPVVRTGQCLSPSAAVMSFSTLWPKENKRRSLPPAIRGRMPVVERQEPCREPDAIALYDELTKRHTLIDIPHGKASAAVGAAVANDHAALSEILKVKI